MSGVNFSLSGKTALITGGSGVLGAAMAQGMAAAGAHVIILARDAGKAGHVVHQIKAAGGSASAQAVDVQDAGALYDAAERLKSEFPRLDILVNAAGGNQAAATATPGQRTFFDLDPAALRQVVDLNLMGTLLPCQAFAPLMGDSGSIVNISSMAADRPLTRVVGYAAAKAAVENFTRWLAITLAREVSPALRVNAIAPGFFLGEQNRALLVNPAGELTARGKTIVDHTPMARFGEPDDLLGTLLWLASDASRFVTGIVVPVDGGFSAFSGV